MCTCSTHPAPRLAPLAESERQRYGERIDPGGDMHEQSKQFMAWAASYELVEAAVHGRRLHEAWMTILPCAVLRLDSGRRVSALVEAVIERLETAT